MGIGTEAPIGHEHVPGWSARMHGLHPGELVGEEGRDDPRQAHPGARMNQPQQSRHGNAAPRPQLGWLAERVREGRGTRAWHIPSHRRDTCDGQATALHPRRLAARRCQSARAAGQRSAAGGWHARDRRPPRSTVGPTDEADDGRRYGHAASATGRAARW
jgi:hypothetical protein